MSTIAKYTSQSVHIDHATAREENQLDVECFEDFPRSNMNHLGPKVQSHVSSSSDEDDSSYDSSEEDRPLVKKSSLRRRDSPPVNKHVSFSQSVLRKNEGHLSIERLKPAADPMPVHWHAQYYDYGYDHEYHYYSHYYQPQGHYYHSAPHRGYYERPQNRKQRRQGHSSHNPSAMLSAWIDRDDHF